MRHAALARHQPAMGGDGQVTHGATVLKANAHKVRRMKGGQLVGFTGGHATINVPSNGTLLVQNFATSSTTLQACVRNVILVN